VAIGDAQRVEAEGGVTFPLSLRLSFDPQEPPWKGVPPELIEAYFFDEFAGQWSTDGLSVTQIDPTAGTVDFETEHLTIFRLGVPRGRPPLVQQLRPPHLPRDTAVSLWGHAFSEPASQNILTFGGAYVTLPLDPTRDPSALALNDAGETIILQDADGRELDRAVLSAAPSNGSSWNRQVDGVPDPAFVEHTSLAASAGSLFSPGTTVAGESFEFIHGVPTASPGPGDLIINEVLLAPPTTFLGDANGDGETIPEEDEFIELVNTTEHPLALGGSTVHTAGGERHRFPAGTILPGGMALVVFGVDDPAHPPSPAGPFGGERFFPDVSSLHHLVATLPLGIPAPGTDFLSVTTFRQTSNPFTVQVLTPLAHGRLPLFEDASDQVPRLSHRQLRLLRAGDVDRDLDLDLLAVSRHTELVLLLNDGFGMFEEAVDRAVLPDGRSRFVDLVFADVTEDGAPDALILDTNPAGSYTHILVLENNGGGFFAPWSSSGILNGAATAGPAAFDVGDLDGDGDLDVAVGMIGDQALVFRNDGTAQFTHTPATDVLPQTQLVVPTDVQLADVDADGHLDVVLAAGQAGLGSSAALQLFHNDGAGAFTDVTTTHLPLVEQGIDAIGLGDLNGDRDLDLVAGSGTHAPWVLGNDGTGRFSHLAAPSLASGRASALEIGDVDGDGDLDLMFSHPPQDQVYLNDGGGMFELLQDLPEQPGNHRDAVLFDVDRDGDLDLLGTGPDVSLLLNTGSRINRPPVLDPIGPQEVTEGDLLEVDVMASDPDEDPLTLAMEVLGGAPVSSLGASFTDHGDATGTFAWTPAADQGTRPGRLYELVVSADDGLLSDEVVVPVIVFDFNRPPTLDPLSNVTVEELELVAIDVAAHAHDPDPGDVLSFGAVGLPLGASLNPSTGLFDWTPSATQGDGPGNHVDYPITFTATDLAGKTADEGLRIRVLDVNHPPQFLGPAVNQQILEGQLLDLLIEVVDPDGDALTVTGPIVPPGATFTQGTRRFEWIPGFTQGRAEPYPARFEATDGEDTAVLELQITVLNNNRPPTFVGLMNQQVTEGELLSFDVVAQDLDGDPLTLSALGTPGGASFTAETGAFAWTPDFTQAGNHLVTFRVTDGIAIVEQVVTIEVLNFNHVPVLSPLDDQEILEGQFIQVGVNVSDADHDPLVVTLEPLPEGALFFQQGAVWIFQWVPGPEQRGVYPLVVEATDGFIAEPLTEPFTITVVNNPGLQRLVSAQGVIANDASPETTPGGSLGTLAQVTLDPGTSLVVDLGEVHPALVSRLELFQVTHGAELLEADLALFVSEDNAAYTPYAGPEVFSTSYNRILLSNLNIPERYIKIHRPVGSDPGRGGMTNFLPEIVRASGAIPLDGETTAFLDDLGERTFLYFTENVNANGLIPDRVGLSDGLPVPGTVYSTGATGFWLASLPIAVERGWITTEQGEAFARRTLEFYLGDDGGPVEGQFGFYYHFVNGDGTRFLDFGGDGVSMLDSMLLFAGAMACGEYFEGDIQTLAATLYDRADWEGFFDHDMNMLGLFWTPEDGFIRHLDYTSEGVLAYVLAAGSTTHPILADPDLPAGADAYYAYSRGNFGRILGRFGRDGKPLLQTFFGSLFSYLYPNVFADFSGQRDAFHIDWVENTREAILANFRFAQTHPELDYGRLFWGISASDGPSGYQGLYGTPPLDPGALGEVHDGTVAPYAVAGSLPFAADLALPTLQHLATLDGLFDRYGLKSGVNVHENFFDPEYLGIDQGALVLGLEGYRTGLIGELLQGSPIFQQALAQLGFHASSPHVLVGSGPRSRHAYLRVDTTDHLTQTIHVPQPNFTVPGDALLELHPYGMDHASGARFVDVDLSVNGQFVKTIRFTDRRSSGVIDVGSVYVPLSPAQLFLETNVLTLTWVGGERWLQLQDVELSGPTGREGTQEHWQIGERDVPGEFGPERFVDDSYLVGDDLTTFEQAVNVVDEPITDVLFELQDPDVDRQLRLVAEQTHNGTGVSIEVSVNDAVAETVILQPGVETMVSISHLLLREGWNHLRLRHANVPSEGEWLLWDVVIFERAPGDEGLQVLLRDVDNDQLAPQIQFGMAPPEGAVLSAEQYLEIHYQLDEVPDQVTISTDNRNAPIHQFTGPLNESAAGLVGAVDSTIVVPLLWQVYDTREASAPPFTDTIEWAYVPDASDPDFQTPPAINYRTLVSASGLGDRPSPGRAGSSPVFVYLTADFRGKPAQPYGTDRLLIEIVQQ